jgi:mannose-6-phosphate isomerase
VTRSRLAAVAAGLASFTARPAADVLPGEASDPELPLVAGIVADLLRRHPRDAGVLLALLLRAIVLEPGQAVHVGPGVLHAYLSGLGVEVMAASDNVLRGGLTEKHVDVEEFLRVLDARVGDDPRVGALAGPAPRDWRRLLAPTSAFLVDEADLDGTLRLERSGTGPSIVLCARGDVIVRAADGSAVRLRPGDAAYVATGTMPVQIAGVGLVFHARAGSDV